MENKGLGNGFGKDARREKENEERKRNKLDRSRAGRTWFVEECKTHKDT